MSERAYAMLENYSWPGNIRELSNLIERAVVLSRGAQLDIGDFPAELGSAPKAPEAPPGQPIALAEAEKRAVLHALTFTHWQKTKAAEILGISWPTLQKKIQDYGLTQPKE